MLHPAARWPIATWLLLVALTACSSPAQEGYGASPSVLPPQHRDDTGSWMSPSAAKSVLLYVSDLGTNAVYAYSYADGTLQGKLTGFKQPWGLCTDSKGDLFVTDHLAARIVEYAHGASAPLRKLLDPNYQPGGCAVDPRTGNLAVANISTPYSLPGNVVVYKNAKGRPEKRKDAEINFYQYCGYDPNGNLYVDGQKSGAFALAEIPYGKSAFTDITLTPAPQYGGSVQWDGNLLAVRDYTLNVIDAYTINGNSGMVSGTTTLSSASYAVQVWIDGGTVVGANSTGGSAMYWKYPVGGAPTKTIAGLSEPWGITVSPAK